MEPISQQRLMLVCPVLAAKVSQVLDQLEQEGTIVRVVQGFRSYQEQAAIYGQGRWLPGRRVTNAPPGHSYHEYGLAVDCVPGVPGIKPWQPDWQEYQDHVRPYVLKPAWQRMIDLGISQGLTSGSQFIDLHDYPHFQLQGSMPIRCPTAEAFAALKAEGKEAVWHLAGLT